jgi:NADPH2:quinone reductase
MHYIEISSAGGPEVMRLTEGPTPSAGPGELLIAVEAAGVNRPDLMQRAGLYPPPPGASPILGLEVAGKVAAVGEGVTEWQVGDAVCALTNGGGYAEYVVVPAVQCLPTPNGLTSVQAAALPETFFTVWSNVFDTAQLQPGETLLVHGGSGGIGTTAIQIAKALGARVLTTAGSDEKCRVCERLGADLAINYRIQDFVTEVKAFTNKVGAHVILDVVGGDYIERNFSAASMDGRIVNIAFQNGSKVELDLMKLMMKRLILTGATLRARTTIYKGYIASQLTKHVWPLISSGRIRPELYRTLPLAEVQQAHRLLESGRVTGKLVLQV